MCFNQWYHNVSLGGSDLFKEEKSGYSLSKSELCNTGWWKCVKAKRKETSNDVRIRAADIH